MQAQIKKLNMRGVEVKDEVSVEEVNGVRSEL
jgi:hypothetical protein